MSTRKYKSTGCAKFFFILIILAPVAYIIAHYVNGEDGLQKFKDLVGKVINIGSDNNQNKDVQDQTTDLQSQLAKLEKDVEYYSEELRKVKQELLDCQNARDSQ